MPQSFASALKKLWRMQSSKIRICVKTRFFTVSLIRQWSCLVLLHFLFLLLFVALICSVHSEVMARSISSIEESIPWEACARYEYDFCNPLKEANWSHCLGFSACKYINSLLRSYFRPKSTFAVRWSHCFSREITRQLFRFAVYLACNFLLVPTWSVEKRAFTAQQHTACPSPFILPTRQWRTWFKRLWGSFWSVLQQFWFLQLR